VRPFRNKETFLPSEVDTFRSRERPGKPLGILVWEPLKKCQWISGGTSWQIMLVVGGKNGKNLEETLQMMVK